MPKILGRAPLPFGVYKREKNGTGATKFKRAETFSRGSLGTSSKQCRAQISKKIKNMFDIEHAQNKLSCNFPKIKKKQS
jgi:hypothetical protein